MNKVCPLEFGYYNMDCMDGMKYFTDGYFDLAIVDPPYFADAGLHYFYGNHISTTGKARTVYHKSCAWEIPDVDYYKELCRVSKHQIIWGINYFNFPNSPHGRIIWDKQRCGIKWSFSDAEIASNSLIKGVRTFRYRWDGMLQGNMKNKEHKIHCTQKPVALYHWILNTYAKKGWKILDTHVGSASSLVACHRLGFNFVGFEKDPTYYKLSKARLQQVQNQISIFDSPKTEICGPEQMVVEI